MFQNPRFDARRALTSALLATVVLAAMARPAAAQGTAFTFQGQLKDGGAQANGAYDMVFRLFDADAGGNQVGLDVPVPGVSVAAGLFTATLDFGAVFTGPPLWLELEVNAAVLSPRQAITASPYAQMAAHAETAAYAFAGPGVSGPWQTLGLDAYYNDGHVGIGTDSPNSKLHVAGGPIWTTNGWTKALAINNAEAIELGYGAGSTRFGIGASLDGLYLFRTATEGTSDSAHYFMSADSAGRIALGDIAGSLTAKLAVFGSGHNAELLRLSTERPWVFRQIHNGPSTGLQLYSTSGLKAFEITAVGGTNVATFAADDANPRVGIGTTTPLTTLDVRGTTRTRVVEITGADLAEKFPTSGGRVEPGTVMEIDPDNAGQLRMARETYNQRVAGVVSGANDFPAGAILGHLPGQENSPAIALSGRVWVKCDATDGAIGVGDLLTTAASPGHAMKATDRRRSHGAVIGKAMTALKDGECGLVLVLVNLQ